MSGAIDFVHDWCDFGEPDDNRAYILMGIARRAHNEELTHSNEIVHRHVISDPDEIDDSYWNIKQLMNRHGYTYRLYITVNARDTLKAFTNFKKQMEQWSEWLIEGNDDGVKLGRVGSEWKSQVHKPQAAADSYFLFDVDDVTPMERDTFRESLRDRTDVVHIRQTPNGEHIITEPFNHTRLTEIERGKYDEMDTDGQVFVEEVEP